MLRRASGELIRDDADKMVGWLKTLGERAPVLLVDEAYDSYTDRWEAVRSRNVTFLGGWHERDGSPRAEVEIERPTGGCNGATSHVNYDFTLEPAVRIDEVLGPLPLRQTIYLHDEPPAVTPPEAFSSRLF